jgi:hypothetical protein
VRLRFEQERIVQVDRNEDRLDVVKTVWSFSKHVKADVDFGTRPKGKRKLVHVRANIVHK